MLKQSWVVGIAVTFKFIFKIILSCFSKFFTMTTNYFYNWGGQGKRIILRALISTWINWYFSVEGGKRRLN